MLAALAAFLLRHAVFAQMLSIGCLLPPHAFADIRRRSGLYARLVFVIVVGLPFGVLGIVTALRPPPFAVALFLLMAICPGAPLLPRATKAKGETYSPVGLDLIVLFSILAPVTIPVWLWILARVSPLELELAITPWAVFRHVFATVLCPLFGGLLLRRAWPRAAPPIGKVAGWFFWAALAVGVVLALQLGASIFDRLQPRTFVTAFVIVMSSALTGWVVASGHADACRPSAMAAAFGNPGLVLAIALSSYPKFHGAAFIAVYVVFRKLAVLPFEVWLKRSGDQAVPMGAVDRPLR